MNYPEIFTSTLSLVATLIKINIYNNTRAGDLQYE